MKKIIPLIIFSLLLVSCGKTDSLFHTGDTSERYFFKEYALEKNNKPIEGAISYEVLMKKVCGEKQMFDSQNTKIVSKTFSCYALIGSKNLFRVMMDDRSYRYYNLIIRYDHTQEKYTHEEFILSDNIF